MSDSSTQWCAAVADGAALLTVNQRLSRRRHEQYGAWRQSRGDRWWPSPIIMPLGAWLQRCHATLLAQGSPVGVLVPALRQQALWLNCLRADRYLPKLLDLPSAAEQARNAWLTAHAWGIELDAERPLSGDQQAFRRWASQYRDLCDREGVIDEAQLPALVTRHLPELQNELPGSFYFSGFLHPVPRVEALVAALGAQGCQTTWQHPSRTAVSRQHVYAGAEQELAGVALQLRARLESEPCASLGLVVADLAQRRAQVLRVFDRVFFPGLDPVEIQRRRRPFEFSLGDSLAAQPPVAAALRVLQLALGVLPAPQVSALLLGPYLVCRPADARSLRRADTRLRDQRLESLTLTGLIELLEPTRTVNQRLGRLRQSLQLAGGGARRFSAWVQLFADGLNRTGWPGATLGSQEYQAVQVFRAALDDTGWADDEEPLNAEAALSLLSRLMNDRVFQPEQPPAPIQILGRLESHGLEFDALWVVGMDGERWPATGTASALLPIVQQRAAGIFEASEQTRLSQARAEVHYWQSSATQVCFSHATSIEGAAVAQASFLADIPVEEAPVMGQAGSDKTERHPVVQLAPEMLVAAGMAMNVPLVRSADEAGLPVAEGDKVGGGARLLENQALCPFRAYATHRLRAKGLEEPGPGLDPRQHGTVLHDALEHFWGKVGSHAALMALDSIDLDGILREVVDAALRTEPMPDALRALESRRLLRLLRDWLDRYEKPRAPFTVELLEEEVVVEHAGIPVTLRLDRQDRLDTGERLVIDYKTGISNDIKSWTEDRIRNPQLPLYALRSDDVDGVVIAQVAQNKSGFKGLAISGDLLKGVEAAGDSAQAWVERRAHWRDSIETLAAEIRTGNARVAPLAKACIHCELKPLCRIEASSLADDQDRPETATDTAQSGWSAEQDA